MQPLFTPKRKSAAKKVELVLKPIEAVEAPEPTEECTSSPVSEEATLEVPESEAPRRKRGGGRKPKVDRCPHCNEILPKKEKKPRDPNSLGAKKNALQSYFMTVRKLPFGDAARETAKYKEHGYVIPAEN